MFVMFLLYFRPDLFHYDTLLSKTAEENLDHAFTVASEHLGVDRLLDPEGKKIKVVIGYTYIYIKLWLVLYGQLDS